MATVTIQLSQGKVALIDESDFPRVSTRTWWAAQTTPKMYAATSDWIDGAPVTVYLHQFIMNPPVGVLIGFRNDNGLDCRRENLREVTGPQRAMGRRKSPGKKSKYKGVSAAKCGHWLALLGGIAPGKKQTYLGTYRTEEEAAIAYNAAAVKHFGEFARINIMEGLTYEEMVTAPDRLRRIYQRRAG